MEDKMIFANMLEKFYVKEKSLLLYSLKAVQ